VSDDVAHLTTRGLGPRARAVVVLLHGGAERGTEPVSRRAGPVLRMLPFGWAIRRRDRSVAVARLRYRRRGWNAGADPIADVDGALARIDARHPGIPVVLVGHSMGGRAALRCAGWPTVVGVVALAPWTPPDDPVDQLAGRALVVIHGAADHRTSPAASALLTERVAGLARSVRYVVVPAGDHAMLRHWARWQRLTVDAVLEIVGAS
jgi:pimeloyl-ACP methyl ester carboxylesterase